MKTMSYFFLCCESGNNEVYNEISLYKIFIYKPRELQEGLSTIQIFTAFKNVSTLSLI